MSDVTISADAAGPTYYGLFGELVQDANVSAQQVDTLTAQEASGLISQTYSGLGSNTKLALDLSNEISRDNTWANNISQADTSISITQSAMNQIGSIASTFYNLTDSMSNLNPSEVDNIAGQAQTALQEVAGLIDTSDNGSYVFAGTDSANAPIDDPTAITDSAFYSAISSAVTSGLSSGSAGYDIGQSTIAAALSAAPFSSSLSNASRTTVTVTNNQRVSIGILANSNAAVTSTGTSTTGSYMLDVMRALATIGSMSSTQVNDPGFNALVADTRTSLNGAMTALDNEEGILGNTQAQIDATGTILSSTTLALATQVSNVEDADMTSVATQLALAQTQLTASYKMIASIGSLSLVNFI